MSNGDGRPSFLRTPTLKTPQCTKATRARAGGHDIEQRRDAVVLDRVTMHGGKETQRRACARWLAPFALSFGGVRRHWIYHHVSVESLRKRCGLPR